MTSAGSADAFLVKLSPPVTPPSFALSGPTSGTFTVGQTVPIQWTAGNVGAGDTISLCFDKDTIWFNGNETWIEIDQVTAANGSGSYTWNTAGVAPGTYYVAGYLWNGTAPTYSHLTQSITLKAAAGDTTPPTATIDPNSVTVSATSATFVVTYTDPDDNVLFSTIDGNDIRVTGPNNFNQLASVVSVTPSSSASSLAATYQISAPGGQWTSANAGTYTAAMQSNQVSDTHNNYVAAGTLGTFAVSAPATPTFSLSGPTSGTFTVGQTVPIQWTAGNVGTGNTISLCFDKDTTWFNGNETWIEIDQVTAANGSGSYTWNTAGVAPGTYYVAGYLWNGTAPTYSHLTQSITLKAAAGDTTPPTATIDPNSVTVSATSATFVVTYTDPDDNVLFSTIDGNDIRVTGPNNFNQLASVVSVTPSSSASSLAATYQISAPGGQWTAGTYTAAMQSNQVSDTHNNYVAAGTLGTFTVSAPATPTFSLTEPTSGTFTVGQTVPIQWTAGNVGTGNTISLCFDKDTTWFNGNETWIEIDKVTAANGSGSYTWDTTGVAPGTYYVAGYLWNGTAPTYSHLTQSITIQAGNSTPTFSLSGPTSGQFTAGQDVPIQWVAGNVTAGNTISLCIDTDPTWWTGKETWIEIDQVKAANGSGSYTWNTTGVAPGTYYVAGYLWNGTAPTYSHLTQSITILAGNSAPTFSLSGPTSGQFTAGQTVPIQWTAGNVGAGDTISLCFDKDTTWFNGNETWIEIDKVSAANGSGSYTWDTTGVAPGTYYVAGYLWNGTAPTYSHLTQSITILAGSAPTFSLSGPISQQFTAGQNVTIQWTDSNVAPGSTISLCYDADTTWWNGNETWIEIDQVTAANGGGSYTWNTAGVAPGTYYIAGYLWSNSQPTFSHLTQSFAIAASAQLTNANSAATDELIFPGSTLTQHHAVDRVFAALGA